MPPPVPSLDPAFRAPILSFLLHATTSTNLARHGELTFHRRPPFDLSPDDEEPACRVIPTPGVIAYASRGALPHLTRDHFAKLPTELVHLSLEHFLDLQPPPFSHAPFSLHRFVGLHESKTLRQPIVTMALRDPTDNTPVPATMDKAAFGRTARGTVKDFVAWTTPRPPDILFAMADDPDTVEPLSAKRTSKSASRSLRWVSDVCAGIQNRTNVFAPLVGGRNVTARREYSESLRGIVKTWPGQLPHQELGPIVDDSLAGYTLTVPTSLADSSPADPSVPSLFLTSLAPLPPTKPRVVLSACGPHDILRLVREVGIDLFVDEWSSRLASLGVGLDFEFPVREGRPADAGTKRDIGHSYFDTKFAQDFRPLSPSDLPVSSPPTLSRPEHPFGPSPPSRAYVHHLLHSHEMTAHVILALHNALVIDALFVSIRRLLAEGGDAFDRHVQLFFEAYEERTPFSGGKYACVEEAEMEWALVEKMRGKGSLKEKRKNDVLEEALGLLDAVDTPAS